MLRLIKSSELIFAFGIITIGIFCINNRPVSALSGSDWRAGNIIDDSIFYNSNAMSTQDIQNFLNQKMPSCDTNGAKTYSGNQTRAQYGANRGVPPPYVCLKDYSQNGLSSAQIIKDAANNYGINPATLLVLLQKEQTLITDDWPWPKQYRSATGFGCPDTAACDDKYYGFFNQVTNAARQFRLYANSPNSYRYKPFQNNYIQYNPVASCGGSNVHIDNYATAGLYNYTPYQPNDSALNNLYGSGDSCGAYGNRNFWRLFNDWFGSGYMPPNNSDLNWRFENLRGKSVGVIPSSAYTGITPATISYNNDIYVFNHDISSGTLRAEIASNTGWSSQVIDGPGTTTSINSANHTVGVYPKPIISNGKLMVFYYDNSLGLLKMATLSDGVWRIETLDGAGGAQGRIIGNVGQKPSVALYDGTIQLFYYNSSGEGLRHAWRDSAGSWRFETLDGRGSFSGKNAIVGTQSSVAQYGQSLQLFYYDASSGNLRHAWTTSSAGWRFEDLDGSSGSVARYNSDTGMDVATLVDPQKNKLIALYRANGMLKYAYSDVNGWKFAFLDGNSNTINFNSPPRPTGINPTATMSGGSLQSFYQENGILRHAWGNY